MQAISLLALPHIVIRNLLLPKTYLHDDSDFDVIINTIARDRDIPPTLIEKDYWIMHCLYGLQQAGKTFYLKGGTSLSKGFKIIDRFSEDIDILIKPQGGQDVKCGKNHDSKAHREGRRKYYETLTNELDIDGIHKIVRDTEFDDKTGKYRSGGIRLYYQTSHDIPQDLKEGIILEVGFDKVSPHKKVTISSWAFDSAKEKGFSYIDNRAIDVPCYRPEYTFVEKLHAINKKYEQEQSGKGFDANFMRHYYDLYKLLEMKEVIDFIGSEEYERHKKTRFKSAKLNQASLLDNPDTFKAYEERYELSKTLYYKEKPTFNEIIERLRSFNARF